MSTLNGETKEEAYDRLKTEAKQIKSDLVEDLASSNLSEEELQDRLYRMIEYAIDRHDWYDKQRYRFLRIGLGVTAVASALASLLASLSGSVDAIPLFAFALSVFVLLGTGITLVVTYNRGVSKDHPYREIADIRSWFFVYNQPEKVEEEISNDKTKAVEQVENVKENIELFTKRWVEYAKEENGFIKEDIEQVFILQTLQRYKYQRVEKLSKYLSYGLTASAVIFFISITFFLAMPKTQSSAFESDGVDSTGQDVEMTNNN